ncbi:MAG: glycosyltransferase family 2 protein [Thermoproteota archaeon]|nr:glycosyltransferase family 2 protein [Thermoproteota archaeon]
MISSALVSVIVLNYNGKKYIEQCIESVLKSDYGNLEILIVDNNSTDDSIDIAETKFKDTRLKIIRSDKNLGFATGNNLGAMHAKGDYIVLLNIDTMVNSKWLKEIISVMESDLSVGVAQPKLLSLDDPSTFDSVGDYVDFFGNSFRRGGDWLEEDHGQYDTIHNIFSARGAALITRKAIVDAIGLFDDDYFLDFEDIDFCWRVKLWGKRVVLIPSSVVYHKGSGISSQDEGIKGMHPAKNLLMTMIKNYDRTHMIAYVLIPHVISFFTGLFLLEQLLMRRNNKLRRIRDRVSAYVWLVRNIRKLQAKRKYVQTKLRKMPDSEIMEDMIETSPLKLAAYLFNIAKFGRSKAGMIYFNKGLPPRAMLQENIS